MDAQLEYVTYAKEILGEKSPKINSDVLESNEFRQWLESKINLYCVSFALLDEIEKSKITDHLTELRE